MDLIARIKTHFDQSIEAKVEAFERVAPDLARAANLITAQLLEEHKTLTCGDAASGLTAQYFATRMLDRLESERSGLPAMALGADAATMEAITEHSGPEEVYARQIRALGHPGDVLLVFTPNGDARSILRAVEAAREREMYVILVTGREAGRVSSALSEHDITVSVPATAPIRIQEVQVLLVHCLCDLVDRQLLGQED